MGYAPWMYPSIYPRIINSKVRAQDVTEYLSKGVFSWVHSGCTRLSMRVLVGYILGMHPGIYPGIRRVYAQDAPGYLSWFL